MIIPVHRLPAAEWERLTGRIYRATPGGLDTATIDARFAACAACPEYVPPLFGKSALCYAKAGCHKLNPTAKAPTCPLGKWPA